MEVFLGPEKYYKVYRDLWWCVYSVMTSVHKRSCSETFECEIENRVLRVSEFQQNHELGPSFSIQLFSLSRTDRLIVFLPERSCEPNELWDKRSAWWVLSAVLHVTPEKRKALLSDLSLEPCRAMKRLRSAALLASRSFFIWLRLGRSSVPGKSLLSSVNLIIYVLERKQARLNKAGTDETRDLLTFFRPPLNQEVDVEHVRRVPPSPFLFVVWFAKAWSRMFKHGDRYLTHPHLHNSP